MPNCFKFSYVCVGVMNGVVKSWSMVIRDSGLPCRDLVLCKLECTNDIDILIATTNLCLPQALHSCSRIIKSSVIKIRETPQGPQRGLSTQFKDTGSPPIVFSDDRVVITLPSSLSVTNTPEGFERCR
jgi:hypothetical protein